MGGEHDIVAPAYCAVTDGLGDMALAGTAGAGDQHGDLLLNEPARGKIGDELLVDAGIEVKIKALQCLVAAKAGAAQTHTVLFLFAASGLILDDQRQELRIAELFLYGLAIAGIEAVEDARKAQLLEYRCQLG